MSDPHIPETLKDLIALLDDTLRSPGSDPTRKQVSIPRYIADAEVARIEKLEADLARMDERRESAEILASDINESYRHSQRKLESDLARVTAALEDVRWTTDRDDDVICAGCLRQHGQGHDDDCLIDKALAQEARAMSDEIPTPNPFIDIRNCTLRNWRRDGERIRFEIDVLDSEMSKGSQITGCDMIAPEGDGIQFLDFADRKREASDE